jgi:uncharacterized lipoprotein YddW (UPF0748 family)
VDQLLSGVVGAATAARSGIMSCCASGVDRAAARRPAHRSAARAPTIPELGIEGAFLSPGTPGGANVGRAQRAGDRHRYPVDGIHLDYIRQPGPERRARQRDAQRVRDSGAASISRGPARSTARAARRRLDSAFARSRASR